MKVTLKNTRILFYLSIANIPVCALIFFFVFEGIQSVIINVLLVEYCVAFILTLVYFILALLRFNEATAVVAAYTMFACIFTISIASSVFPHLLNANYANWLGTLAEVVSLLVAFRSFFVKAPAVSLPFKFFGAGIGLIALPKLFIMLVTTTINGQLISITEDAGLLVILPATCFVLKRMMNFLKNEAAEAPEAVEQQTP